MRKSVAWGPRGHHAGCACTRKRKRETTLTTAKTNNFSLHLETTTTQAKTYSGTTRHFRQTDFFFDKIYSHCGQRAADKNQNITIQFYLTKLITKVSKSSFPCAIHKNVKVDIRDKIKVQVEVSFVFAIIVVLNKRYTIYNIYMRT